MAGEGLPSDLQGGVVLFRKLMTVLVRSDGTDIGARSLDVRVMSGSRRCIGMQKVLRLYVSSPTDPLFLYTMDCGEEDFRVLKASQGLLVDHANFGAKLVGLLDRCVTCGADLEPRFQAVLDEGPAPGPTLHITEQNDLSRRPHLSLGLLSGSEGAVKTYIALRLAEEQARSAELSAELGRALAASKAAVSEAASASEAAAAAAAAAAAERDAHARALEAARAAASEAQRAAVEAVRAAARRELEDARSSAAEALRLAEERCAGLESAHATLRVERQGLETARADLAHQLGCERGAAAAAREEAARLRGEAAALAAALAQGEARAGGLEARVAGLEERLAVAGAATAEHAQRAEALESTLQRVELGKRESARAQESATAALAATEERLRESQAALHLAQTNLVRLGEEAGRLRGTISRQEAELASQRAACQSAREEHDAVVHELEAACKEADGLRAELERARHETREAQCKLEANEVLLRWQNAQLTAQELHQGVPPPGFPPAPATLRNVIAATGTSARHNSAALPGPNRGEAAVQSHHLRLATPAAPTPVLRPWQQWLSSMQARADGIKGVGLPSPASTMPYPPAAPGGAPESGHCRQSKPPAQPRSWNQFLASRAGGR
ncbi:hypothetical protein ACKKBG_A11925 [Auxenochlorella protothecoides x Auxenochlorella symbiontica]